MSEAVLQLINSAGGFLVTDRNPTLVFITSGTVTCTGWDNAIAIPVPPGYECMVIAFRGGGFREHYTSTSQAPKVEGASGTVVTWFMFARALVGVASGEAGLNVYDENGDLTFTTAGQWGVVKDVVTPPQASFSIGTPSANTAPTTETTLYNGAAFPAGKQYAMISRFAHDRAHMPAAPASTVHHFYEVYTCVNNLLITERKHIQAPSDTNDNYFYAQGQIMLVDVTGFGGGGLINHTLTASDISSTGNASGTVQKTSTATVVNGNGPFTYAWTWVGGTPAGLAIVSGANTATVTIESTGTSQTRAGTLRCTVVDTGNGSYSTFDDASVSVAHNAGVSNHTVTVTNVFDLNEPNGTSTKPSTATVSGGVGPFTYAWTWVGTHTGLSFSGSTTGAGVTVSSTGNNQQNTGTVRCTVTDTGNGSITAFDDASVSIQHGTPQ